MPLAWVRALGLGRLTRVLLRLVSASRAAQPNGHLDLVVGHSCRCTAEMLLDEATTLGGRERLGGAPCAACVERSCGPQMSASGNPREETALRSEVCRCGGGARKVFRWGKEPWSVEHFMHAELGPRAMGQKKRSGPRELLWFFSGPKGRFRCEPFLSASPTSYVVPS